MTNEQLRLILDLYADRLDALAIEVGKTIFDGKKEPIKKWVGKGEEPIGHFAAIASLNDSNYEIVEEGKFSAVALIEELAELTRKRALNL